MTRAVAAWRRLLGARAVLTPPGLPRHWTQATFAAHHNVPAVLRPATPTQVQACVRIAHRHGVGLHPVSRGRNWGLGSALPWKAGAVVMDLSRLCAITEYDKALGTARVEAGVTFQQAHDFLVQAQSAFHLPPTGGPPDGSIVGNALERGDVMGHPAAALSRVCGFEVVLPNGACIRTGMRAFTTSPVAGLVADGPGPEFSGLFAQSGMGVVTSLTCWLEPTPPFHQAASAHVAADTGLAALVEQTRTLLQRGALAAPVYIWNAIKALSVMTQMPQHLLRENARGRAMGLALLARRHRLGAWQLHTTSKAHTARQLGSQRAAFRSGLEAVGANVRFGKVLRNCPPSTPGTDNLSAMWWRKPHPPTVGADPHHDGCGFLWVTAVVPLQGKHAAQAVALATDTVRAHGLEAAIALLVHDARAIRMVTSLAWDREQPGEDARGMECHHALLRVLSKAGYPPYRLAMVARGLVVTLPADEARFRMAVANAMGGDTVIAPQRYRFGA